MFCKDTCFSSLACRGLLVEVPDKLPSCNHIINHQLQYMCKTGTESHCTHPGEFTDTMFVNYRKCMPTLSQLVIN